jgi:type-F conjugative transfer system pilin assembly protein TrbC
MAQEKLLPVLILLLLFSFNTRAEERFEFKKEDMEFAKELAATSRQISMTAIKEEWLKLQTMQQSKNGENNQMGQTGLDELLPRKMGYSEYELKIFVSSSMGKELLKNYLSQAKRYKATLVFNGLPGGSWRKLSELVYEVTGGDEEGVSMQIDDLAFVEYGINSVPAFVLAKEKGVFEERGDDEFERPSFDKVTGNIGIRRALEEIVAKGELSMLAAKILEEQLIAEAKSK